MTRSLRVGYVPEHFSTPLHFAQKHGFFEQQGLQVTLVAYPSGTGHMISSLEAKELDIAIGLTEAFVRGTLTDQARSKPPSYEIESTYVSTPLNWAVCTGARRDDINELSQLEGARIGVSRIGSGSHVMSFVLAHEQRFGREPPFSNWRVCDTFAGLRAAVNARECDAFMWEYFTTRAYACGGNERVSENERERELKIIGNILTPWPSWVVVRAAPLDRVTMDRFQTALRGGVDHFRGHPDEAVEFISTELPYSRRDAREWLATVRFDIAPARDAAAKAERVLRISGVLERADGDRRG